MKWSTRTADPPRSAATACAPERVATPAAPIFRGASVASEPGICRGHGVAAPRAPTARFRVRTTGRLAGSAPRNDLVGRKGAASSISSTSTSRPRRSTHRLNTIDIIFTTAAQHVIDLQPRHTRSLVIPGRERSARTRNLPLARRGGRRGQQRRDSGFAPPADWPVVRPGMTSWVERVQRARSRRRQLRDLAVQHRLNTIDIRDRSPAALHPQPRHSGARAQRANPESAASTAWRTPRTATSGFRVRTTGRLAGGTPRNDGAWAEEREGCDSYSLIAFADLT